MDVDHSIRTINCACVIPDPGSLSDDERAANLSLPAFGLDFMKQKLPLATRVFWAMIVATTLCGVNVARCQEHLLPEPVPAVAGDEGPFAIGQVSRKPLPPLDCSRCAGPTPYAPCGSPPQGFLFYGTCPWDDDCTNGMADCVHGNCGHTADAIARTWLRLHDHCWWPFHRSHAGGCGTHSK